MFENFDLLIVKILKCDEILMEIYRNSTKKTKFSEKFG